MTYLKTTLGQPSARAIQALPSPFPHGFPRRQALPTMFFIRTFLGQLLRYEQLPLNPTSWEELLKAFFTWFSTSAKPSKHVFRVVSFTRLDSTRPKTTLGQPSARPFQALPRPLPHGLPRRQALATMFFRVVSSLAFFDLLKKTRKIPSARP